MMDPGEYPPLLDASDLAGYAGAPFSPDVVLDACDSVREEADWHIAPVVEEEVRVDADGGALLMLPTLRLREVISVYDTTNPADPRQITDFRKTAAGMLYRRGGWPDGFESVTVVMKHGYNKCPRGLHSVVAERAQFAAVSSTVGQESAGSVSVSYRNEHSQGEMAADKRIARYRLD